MDEKDNFHKSAIIVIMIMVLLIFIMISFVFIYFFGPYLMYNVFEQRISTPYIGPPSPPPSLNPQYDTSVLRKYFPQNIGEYSRTSFDYTMPPEYNTYFPTIKGGIMASYSREGAPP